MASPPSPYVRREVRSLPPGDKTLAAYARAVKILRERPDDHPTSWAYQAAIHGSEVKPSKKLWNQCKHRSWYFVAWHRMFVYYFEQIVRKVVIETGGPKDWALPYWNYGLGGVHASIPDAFRNPKHKDGTPNPLYVKERAPHINGGAKLPAEATSAEEALSRPQFIGAPEFGGGIGPPNKQFWGETGRLEQTPHNDVHGLVGGRGWMGNPDLAAKDPIFWLHHTNIDRLWATWIAQGHADPSDSRWTKQAFEFFDTGGKLVSKTCSEVLNTIDLGYIYDPLPTEAAVAAVPEPIMPTPSEEPKVVGATTEKVTLVGSPVEIPVEVDERAQPEIRAASSKSDPRRLFLNIEDIEGEVNPGSVYGIYVNLPADADPKDLGAHHVGNVSFFGIERAREPNDDEHAHSMRVSVEVGNTLRSLSGGDAWEGGQVDVTLRPLSLIPAEGQGEEFAQLAETSEQDPPVHIGRVSLSVG